MKRTHRELYELMVMLGLCLFNNIRKANIYAIENTHLVWKQQWENYDD